MGLVGNIQIVGDKLMRTLREDPKFDRFNRSYDSKIKNVNGVEFPKVVSIPKLLNTNSVTDVTAPPAMNANAGTAQNTSEVYAVVRKIGTLPKRISNFDTKVNNIDLLAAELVDHAEQLKQRMIRDIYRTMIGGRNSDGAILCYDPAAPAVPICVPAANMIAWAGAAGVLGNTDFVNMLAMLDLVPVPMENRHMAYWPQEFGDIVTDTVLNSWLAYSGRSYASGQNSDNIYGFTMEKSTELPYVSTSGLSPAPDGATAAFFNPTPEAGGPGVGIEAQRCALGWHQDSVVFGLGENIEFAITDKNTRPDLYGDAIVTAWTHYFVAIARPQGIALSYDNAA